MNYLKLFFPINKNTTDQNQGKDPSLLAKDKNCTYRTGYFCGGSNIYMNLITYEDKIYIASTLQSYVLS